MRGWYMQAVYVRRSNDREFGKMKILMINVVCGIRSTGRICTDLADALEAQGNEVKIAYGREEVPDQYQKYAVRIGSDFDVLLHGSAARILDVAGFGSKRATERFVEWVKGYDPDVIHLHNLHGYYINIEVLFNYLRNCGKKIIWTLHDCWAFTGHSAYCEAVGCNKWKTGCSNCPEIEQYPKSYTDRSESNWERKRTAMQGIAGLSIVTPSKWLSSLVKESFLSEYPVIVVRNGIDTSKFHYTKSDIRIRYDLNDKFVVLGVASVWNDLKGYSDFIKLSNYLDDSFRVIMIGLSENEIKSLPKNIIGIPRTNDVQELAEFYSTADAFLNLSYTESFGLTNIEARLCGGIVICYDSGALTETAGDDGIIIERGNIEEVLDSLKRLKNSNRKRETLSNDEISELDIKCTTAHYLDIILQ